MCNMSVPSLAEPNTRVSRQLLPSSQPLPKVKFDRNTYKVFPITLARPDSHRPSIYYHPPRPISHLRISRPENTKEAIFAALNGQVTGPYNTGKPGPLLTELPAFDNIIKAIKYCGDTAGFSLGEHTATKFRWSLSPNTLGCSGILRSILRGLNP